MSHSSNDIIMYGTTWCSDCVRAKHFLDKKRVSYTFINIEDEPDKVKIVEEINDGKRVVPTILFPNNKILVEPTDKELEQILKKLRIIT